MAVKIRLDFFSNGRDKVNQAISFIDKLKKKTQTGTRSMQQNWKDVAAAVGIAVIALNRVKQFFDGLIQTYEKQIVAETKLEGALRATGHAAGFSYEELEKMAVAMSELTVYADEAVMEAEALLLTFTQIGKEVFPDALEAAADMSTMFGQDLKQSVIQLGTALNDPVRGVGRLRRIGISFTEEQKNMIKNFAEMNDIMGAQKVILQEIQAEFGGVARAMGDNALGELKQLNNAWVDMQEKAGKAFLEGVQPLLKVFNEFISFLEDNIDVFVGVGQAIAFIGSIIVGIIKFVIQFKEAIIAFVAVVFGIPAALSLASAAMTIFNSVVLANPFALIIAGIVGAIAAIANLVKKAQEAERAFRSLRKESENLAEGLLTEAASGAIKNIGELQAALGSLSAQLDKLEEQAVKSNEKQLDVILDLIDTYSDLKKQIERQIEVRREIQLLEDAQEQNLKVYDDYVRALDIVNKKAQQYRDTIAKLVQLRKKQAESSGKEYVPPDVSKLKEALEYWERMGVEISATAEEVRKYGADFKAVIEQREKMEEEFNQKYFNLVNNRLTLLEKEKADTIAQAEEIGAEVASINAYYNELIRRENEKILQDRIKFEEDYIRKYEELTLSRVELLQRERDEALALAREKGANEYVVTRYYAELISRTQQEENQKAVAAEKAAIAELEAEYREFAENRKRFQEEVVNFIIGLSDRWLLTESELLRKQRDQEIANVEEVAARWREEIGYIVDSAGSIRLGIDSPDDWLDSIDGIEASQEEINAYTEEYNRLLAEAQVAELRIAQAKVAVGEEFESQIRSAENQEYLASLIGDTYLANYEIMQKISKEMRSQEDIQRAVIEDRIMALEELISSTESQMAQAGIDSENIVDSLPYLQIIQEAQAAIAYLREELGKIPTEAEKAFLELSEKVGIISQKYLDPLEKKRMILEQELKQVLKYLTILKKRQQLQVAHLSTLDLESEVYEQEKAALQELERSIDGVSKLADNISGQLADLGGVSAGAESAEAMEFMGAAMNGLASVVIWLVDQFIQLIVSTEVWQRYMEDFNTVLVSLMENAVIPLLQAIQPLAIILIELVSVIATLVVPIFLMLGEFVASLMPLLNLLANIIIQVVAILQALAPLIFIVADLANAVLVPVIGTLSSVMGTLGGIIAALTPVFDALGYVLDAVGRVFGSLWAIVDFIISPFIALAEVLFYIVTFQWDRIEGVSVVSPADLIDEMGRIWSQSWQGASAYQQYAFDPTTVPELAMTIEDVNNLDPSGIGATIHGGNVSVHQAPDIYIYQTYTGNIIGAGGMEEVGGFVVEAIQEYVGTGGKVEFYEGQGG